VDIENLFCALPVVVASLQLQLAGHMNKTTIPGDEGKQFDNFF